MRSGNHKTLVAFIGFVLTGLFSLKGAVVRADFEIPDQCRVGEGTYEGDLSGEVIFSTCLGTECREFLVINFRGDIVDEYSAPFPDGFFYLAGIRPEDDGRITYNKDYMVIGGDALAGNGPIEIDAVYAYCGITGTWKFTNVSTDVTKSGTFSIQGTGVGSNRRCEGGEQAQPPVVICGGTCVSSFAPLMLVLCCWMFCNSRGKWRCRRVETR